MPIHLQSLSLSPLDLEALLDRAEEMAPEECCGVLLGIRDRARWRVLRVASCDNVAADRALGFEIGAVDLVRAHQACRESGLEILGFFHSHPKTGPQPSRRDRLEGWVGYAQLILGGGEPWELEAWILPGPSRQPRSVAIERVAA